MKRKTPEDFWLDVEVKEVWLCWPWRRSSHSSGYGQTKYHGRKWSAHRLAWTLTYGDIPDGLSICHDCDTPMCCNPNHLFLGTQKDNTQDMISKGRDSMTGDRSWARRHPELLKRGDQHPSRRSASQWRLSRDKFFNPVPESRSGEKNNRAIVNKDQVREIRRRWSEGESQEKLAKEFGLSQTSVSAICRRKNWKHVE